MSERDLFHGGGAGGRGESGGDSAVRGKITQSAQRKRREKRRSEENPREQGKRKSSGVKPLLHRRE
jgi:hypothetical protein